MISFQWVKEYLLIIEITKCCFKCRKVMKSRRIVFELFLGVFLLMSTSTLLWSGEPEDLIKKIVLKDISLKDGDDLEERSSEEKKEFIELSVNNVKGACMRKTGPRFGEKIISLNEKQNSRYARVHISLLRRTVEEVSTDFRLIKKDEKW